jgi:hypothetical protein
MIQSYLTTMTRLLRLYYTLALHRLQGKVGVNYLLSQKDCEKLITKAEAALLVGRRDPAGPVMSWIMDIFCVQ